MSNIETTRQFHTELSTVCTSLESLFNLAASDHEELCLAAKPALDRFRELLDAGDLIAESD